MKRNIQPRRGQSMVEMALVLPLFLMLVLAMFEYGFMLFKNVSVANAAREGARKAAMNTYDLAKIKAIVKESAIGVDLTDNDICVSTLASDPSFPGAPPSVTVRVIHTHRWIASAFLRVADLDLKASQKAVVVTYGPSHLTVTFTSENCP